MAKTVFILNKNPIASGKMEALLLKLGYSASSHVQLNTLVDSVLENPESVILVDKMQGDISSELQVAELRRQCPRQALLLLISPEEQHLLKKFVKAGISDVILKPFHEETLKLRLKVHTAGVSQGESKNSVILPSPEDEDQGPIKHVS